jgi:hypothetical protein
VLLVSLIINRRLTPDLSEPSRICIEDPTQQEKTGLNSRCKLCSSSKSLKNLTSDVYNPQQSTKDHFHGLDNVSSCCSFCRPGVKVLSIQTKSSPPPSSSSKPFIRVTPEEFKTHPDYRSHSCLPNVLCYCYLVITMLSASSHRFKM